MMFRLGVFVLGLVCSVGCVPVKEESSRAVDTGFIGKGTNELATALLQGYVGKEENQVYSPFGYSAILAVFSEGARGVSREEIANALYFPSDVGAVREAYRSVLERFVGKKFSNSPEFKNWFYIYKNYTVNEELQNVLREYYLTEVKCVERPEDYIKNTRRSPIKETMDPDKKIAMEMSKIEVPPSEENAMKEPVETMKKESSGKAFRAESGASTTEENIENSKYKGGEDIVRADVPEAMQTEDVKMEAVKTEDMKVEPMKTEDMKTEPMKTEDMKMKPMETEDMKMEPMQTENKNMEPMQTENKNMEPMKTEETKMESMPADNEMGLMPVEHFSGMTDSSLRIKGPEAKPRMVIFNGLYYKGEWDTPFEKKPADDSRVFYKSDTEKIFTSTIHSEGVFNYGTIENLDARAIELPYKGGRYSLLVLVPNSRNGLTKLISNLSGYSFKNIYDQLTEKLVNVCLPSFEINTISKPISALNKLGLNKVSSIFNPETADLTGISANDSGLFVEELVQMVTFKVDANYSKANFLTASIASSRSNVQNFQINHPFLFYLRDNLEDIIIVNGKVIDPTPKPNFYFS